MNTDSVKATRILKPSDKLVDNKWVTQPGDFAWEFDFSHFEHGCTEADTKLTVYIHLPGESNWLPIHVQKGPSGGNRVWGWDGNLNEPTFTPSIHNVGTWHGYMTKGMLRSC